MSINERIKTIIDTLENKSRSGFARRVGISPAQTSNIIREKGKVGGKVLSRITLAYPQISEPWLYSEEGDMFKADIPESDKTSLIPVPFERKKRRKRDIEPETPAPVAVRVLTPPQEQNTLSPEATTNQDILGKVLQYAKIPNLTLLATKLNVNPKLLKNVYDGKVSIGRKLAFAIKSKYPEFTAELSGKAKAEKQESEVPKVKRTRTKTNVAAETNIQNPEIQETFDKQPEIKLVPEIKPTQEIKPVQERKSVQEIKLVPEIKPVKESSLLDTFILGQKELIASNTKLVEANQKLVDTLLSFFKK